MLTTVLFIALLSKAQTINWANLSKKQKNIINVNAGVDYSLSYGIGYGYQLRSKLPIVLNTEFSVPSGNNLTDDYKAKIGAQIRWLQLDNVHFTTKIQGVFRRYENDYATLLNFGSDLSGIVGYYKTHWFVAGEVGFDKAIVTHFKNSDLEKENYPDIQDGWYEPSTGGNFYYGIQTGYSQQKFDVYLKAGKITTQTFSDAPLVPFYAQLGVNVKLGK
ncbi:hypothetical protein FRZ67_06150 [Panacibacter ginsenosidivorans]|uniref:Outer membrane beta-barrel protein n=1 Tax=Panacibacter ginsenosidivorans TaxID=1813871 RepID=A0A5B8VFW2_9BACT|nr:hypothetical protein FRZ67_06150 [Panacibacter ginsenosidivorans]